jgi:urease accessory protein
MTTTIPTRTPTSEAGRLELRVERRGPGSAVVRAAGHIPYAPRTVPAGPRWTRVLLVQTIAGPLAGDSVVVDVEVGPGAALELGTNAATLAYPAATPARQILRVRLDEGSRFVWAPAQLIVAAGCNLETVIELELAASAAALTRELVVLGRHGETAGRYTSRLRCEHDGGPLLHDGVEIDASGIARSSGAILAGARAFGSLALLGLDGPAQTFPGELRLAGPGRVMRVLAPDAAALGAALVEPECNYRAALEQYPLSRSDTAT